MLFAIFSLAVLAGARANEVTIASHWAGGFNGEFCVDITSELHGWRAHIKFDQPVKSLEIWNAKIVETLNGNKEYVVENQPYDANQHAGDKLCVNFQGHTDGDVNPKGTVSIEGMANNPTHTEQPGHNNQPGHTNQPGHNTQAPTGTDAPIAVIAPGGHSVTVDTMKIYNNWTGRFEGEMKFPIKENVEGWMINLTSEYPITAWDQNYVSDVKYTSPDKKNFLLVNKVDKDFYKPGDTASFRFVATYDGPKIPHIEATFTNLGVDTNGCGTPPANTDGTKYNYKEVLYKSILFYEAQRSGKLPATQRVKWRYDSALGDKGQNGEDLTGGWFDAGDHVKFNFPMAASVTVLAAGILQWKDAYEAAGQLNYAYDSIKWALDYLLKCHVAKDELYVQVGDAGPDHGYWARPEDMTMPRPAYKITCSRPGSDVAGETAAAFAASYLVFKEKDPVYATTLLDHAKDLYEFANKCKGKYSDSVSAAQGFYTSGNYSDELVWAGIWLYKATNQAKYLEDAEKLWDWEPAWGMSWDDKVAPSQVYLYCMTKDAKYKEAVEKTFQMWMPGGKLPYTPKGLAWRLEWAPLRYASNMAFVALLAADCGIEPEVLRKWAISQIHYALGDAGRSFVVGYGVNPPCHPHHRSASCSWAPSPCGHGFFNTPLCSVHTLCGALVGGPGKGDNYEDSRQNYVMNEVACDYNAGFQSAVAGLESLLVRKISPEKAAG